ncbi:MAG: prepilin-type N-terminal cleavage/methylation domain-containing protein [Clostridium sp.]
MKKNGFTLVETLVGTFIFAITIICSSKFYSMVIMASTNIDLKANNNINLNIAHEFLVSKVQEASFININSGEYYIDGNQVILEKGILRFSSSSQHIAPGITDLKIYHMKGNLYKITTKSGYESIDSIVKRGEYGEI